MSKVIGVYKIVNKANGRIYIGSSNDICTRIASHKRELVRGNHNNNYLQSAWNKYGAGTFEFKVILTCGESERLDREQEAIDKAWGTNGRDIYNIAKNTLAPMTGIEGPMKGRKHSEETRAKMSDAHRGLPSPNKGNRFSKETRLKMSQLRKGRNAGEKNVNAVFTRKLIEKIRAMYLTKKYTQSELAGMFSISQSHVNNIINNKRWYDVEYARLQLREPVKKPMSEETRAKIAAASSGRRASPETIRRMSVHNCNNKQVVQLDTGGRVLSVYRSARDAARSLKIDSSALSRACRGEYRTSGGYRWMYYGDYVKQNK